MTGVHAEARRTGTPRCGLYIWADARHVARVLKAGNAYNGLRAHRDPPSVPGGTLLKISYRYGCVVTGCDAEKLERAAACLSQADFLVTRTREGDAFDTLHIYRLIRTREERGVYERYPARGRELRQEGGVFNGRGEPTGEQVEWTANGGGWAEFSST
jgi:hypothetical protein